MFSCLRLAFAKLLYGYLLSTKLALLLAKVREGPRTNLKLRLRLAFAKLLYGYLLSTKLALLLAKVREGPRTNLKLRLRLAFAKLLSAYLSFAAATPGSSFPSRNSKEAPPPVEICVILSPYPRMFTAAAESPPPMIVVASVSANAFATASVP